MGHQESLTRYDKGGTRRHVPRDHWEEGARSGWSAGVTPGIPVRDEVVVFPPPWDRSSWVSVCLCTSLYVSLCVSVPLSLHLSVSLSVSVYTSLCLCPTLSTPLCFPLCLFLHLSVSLSDYLSILLCLSTPLCLSVYTSLSHSLYTSLCPSLSLPLPTVPDTTRPSSYPLNLSLTNPGPESGGRGVTGARNSLTHGKNRESTPTILGNQEGPRRRRDLSFLLVSGLLTASVCRGNEIFRGGFGGTSPGTGPGIPGGTVVHVTKTLPQLQIFRP